MKKLISSMLLLAIMSPIGVFAEESLDNFEVISQAEKYYKTTITNENVRNYSLGAVESSTTEITEEEYNLGNTSDNISTRGAGTVETTYKKLTTSILSNGGTYRYKTVLTWKNFPSSRSYDVIAIGHNSNVQYNSGLMFSQTYCLSNGGCRTTSAHYPQTFSTGVGTSFAVPTGSLTSLTQTLYYDVRKNTSATIVAQSAYGDYSHATSGVSLAQSKSYSVGTSGITFKNGVGNYYDNINTATATWTGSW